MQVPFNNFVHDYIEYSSGFDYFYKNDKEFTPAFPFSFLIYFGGFRYLVQPPAAPFLIAKRVEKRLRGCRPLGTPLLRNGRCGCLVSVMSALLEISVPKFPLTQRSPPPPACLLRVTNYSADSAPARAPSTLARWRIGHLHMQLVNIVWAGLASARTFAELIK